MRLRTLLLSAALLSTTALYADTIDAVGMHVGSQHFPAKDFNNSNPGIYIKMKSGLTAGTYYNSERRVSVYVGQTYDWGPMSVTLGGITGYKMAVMPMVVPSIRLLRNETTSVRIAVLPKIEKQGATVVHLMLEYKYQ